MPRGVPLICARCLARVHQVEKEVEHDTRIRRNYKNVRGQLNVACWQWVGSAGTSFDSIGVSFREQMPYLLLARRYSWMEGFAKRLLLLQLTFTHLRGVFV